MSNLRNRINNLRREIDAATRTGKAYGRLLAGINHIDVAGAMFLENDKIANEVWQQERLRLEGLMDEMAETVNALEHEIAHLERRAASIG